MQSLCRTTHSNLPRSKRNTRNAGHSPDYRAYDSRWRQGFLCPAKGNSDFSRLRCTTQGSPWRGVRSIRLGAPECSLYAGYLSGGAAALRQADAGIASRRLRRHGDPFGSDADVNGTSSQARAGGLPAKPAARVLAHLSRSKCPGAMDCDRRDSSESYGLGAASALETRV